MRQTNVSRIDLNLLSVFHAIYQAGQLTLAAERLGKSQPAMSHALRRLREMLGDQLFVRSSDGFTPTACANALIGPISEVLDRVEAALTLPLRFDGTTARHTFRLGVNDYSAALVVPRLVTRIRTAGPSIDLRTVHIATTGTADRNLHQLGYELLDSDDIDVSIMHRRDHPPRFTEELLLAERAVCIVSTRNRLVGNKMDLATYLTLGHVKLYFESDEATWVDKELKQLRKKRRVVVTLPHFAAALATVAASDLVATVPASIARSYGAPKGLRLLEHPLAQSDKNEIVQVWHRRNDEDQAHMWLRDAIRESCRGL